jgi:ribosomal protein L7/L12
LKEAKDVVDSVPSTVKKVFLKMRLKVLKKSLEEAELGLSLNSKLSLKE